MRVHRKRVRTRALGAAAAAGVLTATALALPAGAGAATATRSSTPRITVVASGLDNPRDLEVARDGTLWVAEAGHGGPTCVKGGEMGTTCFGLTGAVSTVSKGKVHRQVTGLISAAGQDGTFAEGPVGVSLAGLTPYVVFGGNSTLLPPTLPKATAKVAKQQIGSLARVHGDHLHVLAKVGDFDFAWSARHKNLNPQFPDANPNGVLVSGGHRYVVDAGANTLDEVSSDGRIRILAYFPVPKGSPVDAVPTCVDRGPDGALYVGELLGGTPKPGHARVWRVVPGHKPTVWRTGFTTINGCGFDSRGNFWATEFALGGLGGTSPAAAVVRVRPDGHRDVFGKGVLNFASGFAAGRHGEVYVSNWSVMPANPKSGPSGQVVRIG